MRGAATKSHSFPSVRALGLGGPRRAPKSGVPRGCGAGEGYAALRTVPCCAAPCRAVPSCASPAWTPALTKRRLIAAGWVLGGRSAHALPFQAIVRQQSLILFTARGLWIYARFPSANDMRRDPLQLLLKCIRDIGSAERDGPCLSPGEN